MNPITHLFISYSVAELAGLERRERIIVTAAGMAADIDGLGLVIDLPAKVFGAPTEFYHTYHHVFGHNLLFGLGCTLLALLFARRRRLLSAALVFFVFHLHLLCDIAGSKGPDGSQWPIVYLYPFSSAWQMVWRGQWQLASWQNTLITIACMVFLFYRAWQVGHSPVEIVSRAADGQFVSALRRRFPRME